jgi:hypothetical protein
MRRAGERLDELNVEAASFLSRGPFSVRLERRAGGTSCYCVRVRESPPQVLGLVAAECVYHQRRALDHMVWALAHATRAGGRVTFPLARDKKEFRRDAKASIASLPKPARKLVERFQPFRRAKTLRIPATSEPLALLRSLSQRDERRIPRMVGSLSVQGKGSGFSTRSGVFKDGDVIAELPSQSGEHALSVNDVRFDVAFRDGAAHGHTVVTTLAEVHRHIEHEVLVAFAPLFD